MPTIKWNEKTISVNRVPITGRCIITLSKWEDITSQVGELISMMGTAQHSTSSDVKAAQGRQALRLLSFFFLFISLFLSFFLSIFLILSSSRVFFYILRYLSGTRYNRHVSTYRQNTRTPTGIPEENWDRKFQCLVEQHDDRSRLYFNGDHISNSGWTNIRHLAIK